MTQYPKAEVAGERPRQAKHLPWLALGLVLLVLGAAIALVTMHLRDLVRAQIIQQDGIILFSRAMITENLMQELESLGADPESEPELFLTLIAERVLEEARQHEVIGVRIFDSRGELDLPLMEGDRELSPAELAQLRAGQPISSFEPSASLEDFGQESDSRVPLIHATIPLEYQGKFLAAAEFVLDGRKVADALAELNENLLLYGLVSFLIGGGITSAALIWAFGRLQQTNRILAQRTESLLRANHELTLSAKTSAIGAITAHLIHDLKSPLFGLQSFVSARGSADDEDWDAALSTTQRMQKVIGEIVRILQEEKTTEQYELTLEEVFSLLTSKLEPQARQAGLELSTQLAASGTLMNRDGNIILLVITNIVHNAIQATPTGGRISILASHQPDGVVFEVADTGPGLPPQVLSTLFTPTRSTKAGGTGLGLAISKQLANHIGAELVLKETSGSGTVFQLRVPDRVWISELAVG